MAASRRVVMARLLAASVVCLLLAGPADAGRWRFDSGLSVSSQSTSNISLTAEDQESDTVFTVRPSLSASRRGGRAGLRFLYAPSLRYYVGGTQDNRIDHTLRADGNIELIEEIFFLSANARATQVLIDPADGAGFDNVSNPDAFTQSFSLSITPDIRIPVFQGDYARVRLRPGVNVVFTADSAGGGGGLSERGRRTQLDIISGPFFTRMPWSVRYDNDIFDVDTDDGIGRVDGTIGYRFSPRYRLDATLGYDNGRYDSQGSNSGVRWRLTFNWRPVSRTSMSLGYGQAFYGDDWAFDLRHRHKRTVWTAGYDVSVQTVRQEILEFDVVPFVDEFGEPIRNPLTGEELVALVGTPALTDEVFIRSGLRFGVSFAAGRTNARLQGRYDERDFENSDRDSADARLDLILSRRLTPKTSGNLSLRYWDHSEDANSDADFEEYAATVGMSYRLGRRISLGLDYRYTTRNAADPDRDFEDGRVGLRLNINYSL